MSGNPRENVKERGFWDGGLPGHGRDSETGGRTSGFPGTRFAKRTGIRTDLESLPDTGSKDTDPVT